MLQLVVAQSVAVPDPLLSAQVTQEPEGCSSSQSHQNLSPCSGRGLESHNLGLQWTPQCPESSFPGLWCFPVPGSLWIPSPTAVFVSKELLSFQGFLSVPHMEESRNMRKIQTE